MKNDINDLLVGVFNFGLDEDAHLRYLYNFCEDTSVEDLETALQELNKDSFEYKLLFNLIEDMKRKVEK